MAQERKDSRKQIVLEIMRLSGVPLRAKDIAQVLDYDYSATEIAATLAALRKEGVVVKFTLPDPRWCHPGTGRMGSASGAAWMLKGSDRKLMWEMRQLAERGLLTNRAQRNKAPITADMVQMIYDMEQRVGE